MGEIADTNEQIYKPSLRDIAYHEAGHVVTGYLFYSVDFAIIKPGRLLEFATLGSAKINTPENNYLGGAENKANFNEYLKIIICLRAGRFFQYFASKVDDIEGAQQDERFLSLFLLDENDFFYYPLARYSANICRLFCSDQRVLDMVETIAQALLEKSKLNGSEIAELLKDLTFDCNNLLKSIHDMYYPGFVLAWKQLKENVPDNPISEESVGD